jgi:hypothetical protein
VALLVPRMLLGILQKEARIVRDRLPQFATLLAELGYVPSQLASQVSWMVVLMTCSRMMRAATMMIVEGFLIAESEDLCTAGGR